MNRCALCCGMQSHLIPKQQKAFVLKVKRLYNDLSCVRTGVFRLSVPLIFFSFFLLYPSIVSVQLFCTPLLLWKEVMHLESDYVPSMFVSSLVGSSVTWSVSDVSLSDLQFHHCVCPLVELLRICCAILSILDNEGYLLMQLFVFGFVLCILLSFLSWLVQYLYSVTDLFYILYIDVFLYS